MRRDAASKIGRGAARLPMLSDRLETTRLVLRTWRLGDAVELRAVLDANDGHLRPWIPFMVHEPRTLEETSRWLEEIQEAFRTGAALRYRVDLREAEGLLGEVMLIDRVGESALECGYWFAAEATGRGFATEAVERIVNAAFSELGAASVEFHCDQRNIPSNALPRRLGATLEGALDADGPQAPARLNVWRLARR